VFVNSTAGILLGSPVADKNGVFKLPFVVDEQGPKVSRIWAQQGSFGVGLEVEEVEVPR
jgi:hypothetical protein